MLLKFWEHVLALNNLLSKTFNFYITLITSNINCIGNLEITRAVWFRVTRRLGCFRLADIWEVWPVSFWTGRSSACWAVVAVSEVAGQSWRRPNRDFRPRFESRRRSTGSGRLARRLSYRCSCPYLSPGRCKCWGRSRNTEKATRYFDKALTQC